MKIKKYLFNLILPILALVVICLRLTHKISPSTFGLIIALIGFIRIQFFDTLKTKEKPITDLKNYFNPIKKRYNYVVGLVMLVGFFYLFILIFSIFGQF
jgi:predicted neutral ceramidase superfamily lipid hydrolase